jgi:hypothetical protein
MSEESAKKRRFPRWVWLVVILFPIPFGVVHWWVTLIFFAIFAVLMWAITNYYNKNPSG